METQQDGPGRLRSRAATEPLSDDADRTALIVYPVGVVADCLRVWHAWRRLRDHPERMSVTKANWRLAARAISRDWRKRSAWNGFLAEPGTWPDDWSPAVRARCGSGLTPARARRCWEQRKQEAGCAAA